MNFFFPAQQIGFLRIAVMSIQIGSGFVDLNNVTTSRERLILKSTVNSNMVQLESSLNVVNVTMNDFVIGKSNTAFRVDTGTNPLLSLSTAQNILYSDTTISKGLTVTSNMNVAGIAIVGTRVQTPTVVTSNVSITCSEAPTSSVPFVRASLRNAQETFAILPNGTARMTGPLGIGTTTPQQALHVQGMILSSSNIDVKGVYTPRINGTGTNSNLEIFGTNVIVRGNFAIQGGTFSFDDDLTLQNLRAKAGIFGERISLTNSNLMVDPALSLNYTGDMAERYSYLDIQEITMSNYTFSNTVDEFMNPITLSNLTLSNYTQSNYVDTASNLYQLVNINFAFPDLDNAPTLSNVSALSIDTFGRVGLGTSEAEALLHMKYREFNMACNILEVNGRDDRMMVIDRYAQIGIGTDVAHHCLHIDPPALSNNHPLIGLYGVNTPFLAAYSNNAEVLHIAESGALSINKTVHDSYYFLDVDGPSRLQDLEPLYIRGNPITCNIDFQASQLSNIEHLYACNAYVDRLQSHVVDTHYIYGSNLSVVGFKCFSWENIFSISLSNFWLSGQGMLMSPTSNDLQTNHVSDGKLKIIVNPANDPLDISRGVSVTGPTNTSIRVHSLSNTAYLELTQGELAQSNTGIISYNGDTISLGHAEYDFQQLVIGKSVSGGSVKLVNDIFAQGGFLGIKLGEGVVPTQPLDIKGNVLVKNDTTPILFVNTTTSKVSIGTTTPLVDYVLHAEGGFFAQGASRINSDFSVGGRIGIGTTIANEYASIVAPNTFTGNNAVRVVNQSAANAFHILNNTTSAFLINSAGRIGIATTAPQFTLHVNGDLNFDGSLYEKGSKYISSQWTSLSNQDLIFSSNVGIGTTIPNYRLQVQGSTYFSGLSTFGSNITSDGTMYAKGSFVSTSDRNVKTNLAPITDALDKIQQLTGYTYDRTDTQRHEAGLVAQEVIQVLPEVVSKDDRDMYTIAYGNMAGLFVEALKEMKQEIMALKQELASLKSAHK